MALSPQSEKILSLGRALVAQLEMGDRPDPVASWMAHYVAELMEEVQNATPNYRRSAQERCASAIFLLWEQRHNLPMSRRPFSKLEEMIRFLASLDPAREDINPFAEIRELLGAASPEETLGEAVSGIRQATIGAKSLISFLVRKAAGEVAMESADLREAALDNALGDAEDLKALKALEEILGAPPGSAMHSLEIAEMRRNLEHITALQRICKEATKELRQAIVLTQESTKLGKSSS